MLGLRIRNKAQTSQGSSGSAALLPWLWLVYAISRYFMLTSLHMPEPLWVYLRLMREDLLPEYGPLANLLAYLQLHVRLPLPSDADHLMRAVGDKAVPAMQYALASKALALLVDAAVFHLLSRRLAPTHLSAYLAFSILLSPIWLDRFDLYIGALLVASIVLSERARPTALAGAGLIKFPFFALCALDWLRAPSWAALRAAAIAIAGAALILLLAHAIFGPRAATTQFFFHMERTVQIESLLGNLLVAGAMQGLGDVRVVEEWGAAHVHAIALEDGILRGLSRLVLVAGVAISAWRIWRWGTRMPYPLALLLAVTAYTAFNPVGSPQFAIAVGMLGPSGLARGGRADKAGLAILLCYGIAAAVGVARFPNWTADSPGTFVAATLARNLLLLAFWVYLLSRKPG